MPTKSELLAHEKNNDEMCEYIKAKLKFLSLDGMYKALAGEKRNKITSICDHCFGVSY